MDNPIPVSLACPEAKYLVAKLMYHGCRHKTANQCVLMWVRSWKDSVSFDSVSVIDETEEFAEWMQSRFYKLCVKLQDRDLAPPFRAVLETELQWARVTIRDILEVPDF